MADVKEATESAEEQTNGSSETNGGTGRTALRAAAIAAASGATAIAAKKALSSRSESDDQTDEEKGGRKQNGGEVLTTALSSGWDSARDSVVPMLGNAAVQAGEYVARSAPELVRDTIVPQFIRGFERARKSSGDDEE